MLGSLVRNSGDLWLLFDENLSDALPPKSAFSITADGSPISVGSVSHPQDDGLRLAGLSPSIGEGQRVRLRYTDPTAGDDTNAIQDGDGVDAASFTISDVTNRSAITLPALTAAAVPADGGTVALTFSRDLDFSGTFTATIRDAFSVTVDGTANAVTGFSGSGKTATLTVSDTIEGGQTVVVGYDRSDAGGEALADEDDDKKQVADFTTGVDSVPVVTNNATAGPAKLASAAVDAAGTQLTLTFNKSLNAESSARAWITVTADGAEVPINAFQGLSAAGDSFDILFNAGSPIYKDEAVVVVYEKPAGSDGLTDEAQDLPVASFTTGQDGVPAVTNAATALAPPSPDTTDSRSKVGSGGSGLLLVFDGPLATDNAPPASAFSITAGGVAIGVSAVLLTSNMTEGFVSLAGLTPKVRQGETVALTYTDPTTGNDTNALQSPTGADVRTFTVTLTNDSTVTIGSPRPPTGLTATALGATIVDLAWTAPADDGGSTITGYKVEVSSTGSSGWTELEDDTESMLALYRHTGLSSGNTRHYRVSAINAQGTSPASATADATTMTGAHHAVPATIYGDAIWSAEMTVGSGAGALGYDIFLDQPTGNLTPSSFDHGGTVTVEALIRYPGAAGRGIFNWDGSLGLGLFTLHLGPDSSEWRRHATSTAGQYSWSNIPHNWQHGDTVDIRLVQVTAPAMPTGLSATAMGNAQIDLAWTAPADDGGRAVTGYKVEVSNDGSSGSWEDLVADTGSADTEYSHTGLSVGQTRHYRVSAINAAGTSDASVSDSATTTPGGDPVPAIVAVAVTSTPLLTSGGGSEADTYGRGEEIEFSVTFSEAVEVMGDPQFGFSLAGARTAGYDSGRSDGATLVFVYTVLPDDTDDNGIWVGNHSSSTRTLQLDSDDAIAAAVVGGADADLEHDRLNQLDGHKVDGSRVSEDVPEEPVRVTLHLGAADGEVAEDGGAVTVTARASRGAASAFTVTVSFEPVAPATAGDFTLSTNRVLRFAANATASTGTVTVTPVDDEVPEPPEAVRVSGAVSGADIADPEPVTLSIANDDGLPGAPEKPALTAVQGSFTSLEASWDEPALDGAAAVTGYELQYREGAGGAWTGWRHEGVGTTARLTGLAAETAYRVRVRALNGAEAGGWSPPSDEVRTGAYTIRGGICNRSPRVEDRIMLRLKYKHGFKGGCADVTEVELAQVKHLFLRRNPSTEGAFTVSLRRDDFEGLWNLVKLDLADTRLGSLPAGVFAGLTDLEVLNLNKNRLRLLPAGVFAGLRSLVKLRLQKNPSLRSVLPYDEFEALPALTLLRVDPEGRRTLQVAGRVADAELEVAAGGAATYRVRLMHRPTHTPTQRPAVTLSSLTPGVTVSPETLRFTKQNWFRSQTVTVRAAASLAGETARVEHDSTAVTLDEDPPVLTVRVLEPFSARFASQPARHDGKKRVKLRVEFSEPVEGSPQSVGAHGVRVNGGRVTSARAVGGGAADGAAGRSAGRSAARSAPPSGDGAPGGEVVWEFEVEPDSEADLTVSLVAGRPCEAAGAICTADGRSLSEGISTTVRGPQTEPELPPLTASFEAVPGEHDGERAFTFRIAFSEPLSMMNGRRLREDVVAVSGGRATAAGRVDRRRDLWELTVEPDSPVDVTVTLEAGAACGTLAAVCTKDGRALSNAISATVAGPAQESGPAPLTASFSGLPETHGGGSAFGFRIAFSEAVAIAPGALGSDGLRVSGGAVADVGRVDGRADLFEVSVRPGGGGDVTIVLPGGRECGAAGAVCTQGEPARPLANTARATVRGLVSLSVADARAREGEDPTLDFAVTLDRASSGTVTVDYATLDASAKAGEDYEARSGTLRFAPGETAKTVAVPVLDDAHDEGTEHLVFRLDNARGALIADRFGVGRIENTDHMPAAWLARFGRTVTDQVLDAVGERLAAPRAAGARARLAGQALPFWDGDAEAAANDNAGADPGTGSGAGASERALAARERDAMTAIRDWMARSGAGGPGASDPWGEGPEDRERSRALTGRDFLTGTSFALTGGSAEVGGYAALWGRGAISRFDGREGDLSLDGEVTTGLMGADWASGPGSRRWTAGLAVGHARGTGSYREGGGCGATNGEEGKDPGASRCAGEVEATLTGVWPYGGLQLTDRLSAWGAAGYGAGEMKLTPGGGSPFTADLTMAMGAAGLRGEVLTPPEEGGLALAVKGDARFTRTASEATRDADGGRLEAAEADVWLLRTGIEGSRRFVLGGDTEGMVIEPSFEIGARLDGGDAETGLGVDLGGGLSFSAPRQGVALDLKGRGLIAHEASGFREWGASASLTWDPRPTTDRGLALRLRQSWGGSPTGGMDALLGRETLAGLAANDDGGTASAGRFEAELGFGLPLFDGGFTGTPNLGIGFSETGRDYRVGWRLTSARKGDPGFRIDLDATRREGANADAEHGLMLRGTVRW